MKQACILAAVNQFPQDEAVLLRAMEVAAQQGFRLIVAHIIDTGGAGTLSGTTALVEQALLAAQGRIEAVLASLGLDRRVIDIRLESGVPALRLIEICTELSPALVVMRAHQNVRIAERLLGSTPERMIASGVAPVLVLKRPANAPYSRITVASDGSADAPAAVALAAGLWPEAALHLVQAVQIPPPFEEAMLRIGTEQGELEAQRAALADEAGQHLSMLCAAYPQRATFRVLRGEAAGALIRASRSVKSQLMVLGPGRASLLRRAFIGSVTRRLLRDAACDILIFRPADESG